MLKSLTLKNFRGFSEHRIEFGNESILIGRNNAGKTTIIEALRVLSVCQMRALNASFIPCPQWLDKHCQGPGFRPSLETIDFDFSNVQHGYDTTEPAQIRAKLTNSNEISVFIGREASEVFCQLRKGQRSPIHQRSDFTSKSFGLTKVMPPVGSLLPREKQIAKDRLNRYLDGYLAYRHFRNQLWERLPDYRLFKQLLEDTWGGLSIQHFENDHGEHRNEFSLLVREGRFTSEVSWHGHGLQAWMQTVWFLARVDKDSTIVLDEPDVYLHADLQRKLIKMIESLRFRQAIVATHSPEIISDVPFQNVVVVQKKERVSRAAQNAAAIQNSLRQMGSIHSVQLSKLASRGLVLLVEGEDRLFLSEIAYKLGTSSFDAFSEVAVQEIEGSGNWQRALVASSTLFQVSGGEVSALLLLDSDYVDNVTQVNRVDRAAEHHLTLKYWKKKEIENYYIKPSVIHRYITTHCDDGVEVNISEIEDLLESTVKSLEDDVILSIADFIQGEEKGLKPKSAVNKAKDRVKLYLDSGGSLIDMVPGKQLISQISRHSQERYSVSFNALALCKEAYISEIDIEMQDFVRYICRRPS